MVFSFMPTRMPFPQQPFFLPLRPFLKKSLLDCHGFPGPSAYQRLERIQPFLRTDIYEKLNLDIAIRNGNLKGKVCRRRRVGM